MVTVVNLVKQTWCFGMMLPVGVVLYMPGQYQVFPYLAAIMAARRRGMLATRRCRCSTWISVHLSCRAWRRSARFWGELSILVIALPNSFQICSMGLQSGDLVGCSILMTLPSWRKSRTTLARWGSGSYPRNAAWQMALRCFTKCPCRSHRWGICWGAQWAIWYHCE